MNLKKKLMMTLAVLLCSLMFAAGYSKDAEAATSSYNLLTSVKTVSGGYFTNDGHGLKYVKKNGKYIKNAWRKINGKVYRFGLNGYLSGGWQTYKGNLYYTRKTGSKRGTPATGWKTIKGKRYYFVKKTAAAATGFTKIGRYLYYFNAKGVLQKGITVNGYKLNASNGRATKLVTTTTSNSAGTSDTTTQNSTTAENTTAVQIMSSAALQKDHRSVDIFIGDSRTVGLCSAITGVSLNGTVYGRTTLTGSEYYLGKVSEGYDWFKSGSATYNGKKMTPEKVLTKLLTANPTAAVTVNLGVNDLGNITYYIDMYRELMIQYPKAKFVFMSVNPVNTKLYKGYATPTRIVAFNTKLRAAFPNNYVDTYNYLQVQEFGTVDGLHYDSVTYQKIYNYVLTYM